MKCPHCGKEIDEKPAEIIWMRINGKSQSIEKVEAVGKQITSWYYAKKGGPRIIYVKDKP